MTRQRASCLVAGIVAAASIIACAPIQVATYEQPAADAARYGTYAWQAANGRATGDPRLDGHSPFEGYVTAAIDEQLRAKGFEPAATGIPDVVVRWNAATEQRIYLGAGRSEERCIDCRLDIFDEGTLVIDMLDGRTGQLVWRGWASGALDGVVADQERMVRRLHEAITRILERLPRRFTGSDLT